MPLTPSLHCMTGKELADLTMSDPYMEPPSALRGTPVSTEIPIMHNQPGWFSGLLHFLALWWLLISLHWGIRSEHCCVQQNPPQTLSITWGNSGFKTRWGSSLPPLKIYRENQKVFSRFFNLRLTNSYFSSRELYVHSVCTNRNRSSLYHSKKVLFFFFPVDFQPFDLGEVIKQLFP